MKSIDQFLPFSLDQLTMFLAVVDAGTFAKASARVGRVQSAVSTAVANLEKALGTPLFERSGRRSVLTSAGWRLAAEARLAVAQAREVEQCAASLRAGVEPTLAVAIDTLFPRDVLFQALESFHDEFPRVLLRVHEDTLSRRAVEDGLVDFGICNLAGSFAPTTLITRPCRAVHLVPVCSKDHPLADATGPQTETALRSFVQIVLTERSTAVHDDLGVLAAKTWRVTDIETKHGLLRAGVGWGSMPVARVEADLAAGRLIRLEPKPWPEGHSIELHSVVPAASPLGPAGRWLERELADRSQPT